LAFQVIEDSDNVSLPEFDLRTSEIALVSTYKPLREATIRMLIESSPSAEAELSIEAVTTLLMEADDEQFSKLVERAYNKTLPFGHTNLLLVIRQILNDEKLPLSRRSALAVYELRSAKLLLYTKNYFFSKLPFVEVIVENHGADYLYEFPDLFTHIDRYSLETVAGMLMEKFPKDTSFLQPLFEAITSRREAKELGDHDLCNLMGHFLKAGEGDFRAFAWRIFDGNYSNSLCLYAPKAYSLRRLPDGDKSSFINDLLQRADESIIVDLISLLRTSPDWTGFVDLIAVLDYEGTEKFAWEVLADPEQTEYHDRILKSSQLVKRIGDSLQISQMSLASGLQLELVISYLGSENLRAKIDPEFIFAASTSATVELSEAGLQALKNAGLSDSYWLRLAESGLPNCVDEAMRFVKSKQQEGKWGENVLALLDSKVEAAKQLGLRFLDSEEREIDMFQIWNALTESDDPEIIARVAEEALVSDLITDEKLAELDGRVLVTRRKSRGAKESIKRRLDLEAFEIAPKRLRALFELARAQNTRDREWAISRLAVLSLNGIEIPAFEAYETSGGGKDA